MFWVFGVRFATKLAPSLRRFTIHIAPHTLKPAGPPRVSSLLPGHHTCLGTAPTRKRPPITLSTSERSLFTSTSRKNDTPSATRISSRPPLPRMGNSHYLWRTALPVTTFIQAANTITATGPPAARSTTASAIETLDRHLLVTTAVSSIQSVYSRHLRHSGGREYLHAQTTSIITSERELICFKETGRLSGLQLQQGDNLPPCSVLQYNTIHIFAEQFSARRFRVPSRFYHV